MKNGGSTRTEEMHTHTWEEQQRQMFNGSEGGLAAAQEAAGHVSCTFY